MPPTEATLARWFGDHRAFLWGLAYRVTGSAADADDVVQETFVKAHRHAPNELEDPRRWLTRVAVNTARDALRRRKRQSYIGPWLPMPIDTGNEAIPSFEPALEGRTLEGRYDLLESVSLAFLQALEALTPTQRAVLLLRDVFDYSAAEVAGVLGSSAGNVRIIHLRARRAMEAYEERRTPPSAAQRERSGQALKTFLALLAEGDVPGIEQLLARDVRAVSDANGEFTALLQPLTGRDRVAQFFGQFAADRRRGPTTIAIRQINGQPTADIQPFEPVGRRPPRLLLTVDLDASGAIANIWIIASTAKLTSVRP